MTAALAAPSIEAFADDAPRGHIQDSYCDPMVYVTVGRMLDFCNQRPMSEPFTARGIVIDTTADIAAQLRAFFPSHIDLTPVIDRIAEVCLERARATAQPLQVVSFDHLKQIKPIESDAGNMDSFIEVFADRRVKITQYMGHKTALKAGAGGGAAGDPNQMLAELRQADIQGFGLQIKSLDISDAKATELLGKMGIAQAFGADGMAIGGALETIAKGGPDAKALTAVVEQVAEIKTLKTALNNAPDAAAAQPIAAAIAIKTEMLSAQLPTIQAVSPQTTAAIKTNVAQTIETVKVTLTSLQMESVTTKLAAVLPAGVGKMAATMRHDTMSVQISRAVGALDAIARTNAMPVRDVIALVMTKNATPAMTKAVETLTAIMAKPEFLPTIERGLPASVALPVREILTTPVLQHTSAAPVQVSAVVKALNTLAEKSNVPTIKAAAEVVMNIGGNRAAVESVAPVLRVPQLQAVIDNMQAVAMTKAVPAALKTELATVTAQVQALTVQLRSPAPATMPTAPQPLPPQSPLAVIAQAVNIKPAAQVPAPQPATVELKGAPNHWGETPNAQSERLTIRTPVPANDVSGSAPVMRAAEAAPQPTAFTPVSPTPVSPAPVSPTVVSTAPVSPAPAAPSASVPPVSHAPAPQTPVASAPTTISQPVVLKGADAPVVTPPVVTPQQPAAPAESAQVVTHTAPRTPSQTDASPVLPVASPPVAPTTPVTSTGPAQPTVVPPVAPQPVATQAGPAQRAPQQPAEERRGPVEPRVVQPTTPTQKVDQPHGGGGADNRITTHQQIVTQPTSRDTGGEAPRADGETVKKTVIMLKQEKPTTKNGAVDPEKKPDPQKKGACPNCSGAFCAACTKMTVTGADAGQAAKDAGVSTKIYEAYNQRPPKLGLN